MSAYGALHYSYTFQSQAARQGLAVLMASAVVVLKHETLCQSHNFISIELKFGVGDIWVTRVL